MVEKGTIGAEAWTDKAIAWHSAAISYNLAASWKFKKIYILKLSLQINLCQKHSFLPLWTQNIMIVCWITSSVQENYKFSTYMLCTSNCSECQNKKQFDALNF